MKHKFLLKTMLLLCALIAGSGSVWADDPIYTLSFTKLTTGTNYNSYTAVHDITCSTIGWSVYGNQSIGNYIRVGGKNTTNTDRTLTSKAVLSSTKKIGKVSINHNGITNGTNTTITINSITVEGSTSSSFTSSKTKTITSPSVASSGTLDFSLEDGDWDANSYFKITLNYKVTTTKTANNSYLTITSVDFYEAAAAGTPTISADDVEINYDDTEGGIIYEIGNYDEDKFVSVVATTEADWISGFTYDRDNEIGEVDFTTTTNTGVVDRSATVTLTYTYDTDKTVTKDVTVTQGVNPDLGTSTLPYTIAQAKAKIDSGSDLTGKYVHGIISQIDSYSSNAITYWISDDGTTTNQFEVYKGKGLNNANFTAMTDLELGDVVTICGTLKKFGSTYEFDSGSYITSLERKEDSDLAVTSSNPVALTITSAELNPTSTITLSSSSTGAKTFSSNAEGVATVSNVGVITAVGAGSATITISQEADATYKAGEVTVTVNVTDNRDVVATGIDLTSAKTITKDATDDITAGSTPAAGFTGTVTYSYVSADPSVFSIADGKYTGAGVGATTVTVTATPTGGNAANYKPASQEVAVTVNGTNSISLNETSKSQAYTAGAFTLTATVPTENYSGTVIAVSSNTSVATVDVEGTTVTVTPVAVGTATITVTAGTGTYYPTTASTTCTLTVTAPEGKTTAYQALTTFFNETFNDCEGNGGRDGTYTGSVGQSSVTSDETWTGTSGHGAYQCIKLGSSSATQYVKTGTISMTGNGTLTFWAAGWGDTNTNKVTVSAEGATLSGTTEITLTASTWKEYTIDIEDATGAVKIQFAMKRGFLDDVVVTQAGEAITAKLNASGYATFCSQYPLDFTGVTDFSAWQITDISTSNEITFERVTGAVKGGTGLFLKGEAGDINIPSTDSSNDISSTNKLVGTTAPTYFAEGEIYGLAGDTFKKNSAGSIRANKAYIPANLITVSGSGNGGGAKAFTFIFDDEATGIKTIETVSAEEAAQIFNLAGQRISKMQKGINIVNGKKIAIK